MRKNTLFISAALTTFMLAVMFGVASAYQKIVQTSGSPEAVQQAQPAEVIADTSRAVPAGTVTIEQAADVASSVIGRSDLYAAENTQLNGVDAYLVTFSSGDIVYVGLDGKVLSISKIPVTYIAGQPTWVGRSGNGGGDAPSVAPAAPASTSGTTTTSGGEDHSNEDDPSNTEDHGNEDHPSEHDD